MNISYDSKVNAIYIRLVPGGQQVETRHVDEDIALNFDERDRLVGIEVLDASSRVDLSYLMPVTLADDDNGSGPSKAAAGLLGNRKWNRLRDELLRRKNARIPVETLDFRWKNWIEEVGSDYVILRREKGKRKSIRITQRTIEGNADRPYILRALRKLAGDRDAKELSE